MPLPTMALNICAVAAEPGRRRVAEFVRRLHDDVEILSCIQLLKPGLKLRVKHAFDHGFREFFEEANH